jgi:polar amino acid transport system substrate-binding protein
MIRNSIARSLAALALASAMGTAAAADKPSFVDGGKFTVCTDPSFPPMEYFKVSGDKEPVGFDVDLMRALAKNWRPASRSCPWISPAFCPRSKPSAAMR